MAKKVFTYRGKTLKELQELSRDEFAELLTSRARRTLTRGYPDEWKLAEEKILTQDNVKTHIRGIIILPQMVGKVIKVHNGKEFKDVRVQEEMIGHRLGEFAQTRNNVRHSSPGVGATRSSAAASVR